MKTFRSFPIVLATVVVGLGVSRDLLTDSNDRTTVSDTASAGATIAHNKPTANTKAVSERAMELTARMTQDNNRP